MKKMTYSFDDFNASSALIRALINGNDSTKPFINHFFSEDELIEQTSRRSFSVDRRKKLVNRLQNQNAGLNLSKNSQQNIERLLDDNTYTITTGHQLNMASGPLYTLYKIIEIINWCEKLNATQDKRYFVPVFWMATEDHDFEEINHINLFGRKLSWSHQSVDNCVVGRITNRAIQEFIDQVLGMFKDETLKKQVATFLNAYQNHDSLARANRALINELFGDYGLVILDGDDKALKQSFLPIAIAEIEESVTVKTVSKTNEELKTKGFHQQVFVRDCNLFYIEPDGERVRIERIDNEFVIKHQKYRLEELKELLNVYPERFSPNALLRPLYQESILPNVAYVGGGGEIAYWLQLKSTFEALNTVFPILKVRDSVLLVDNKMAEQLAAFQYDILDLKTDTDLLLKDFVKKNQSIELSLQEQKQALAGLKQKVLTKALLIDKNATAFIEAEFQRMDNQLDKMEKKFVAAEKKNQEKALKQVEKLQQRIFPHGGFQERYENYLNYIQIPNFIEIIKSGLKERMTAKAAIHIVKL
jgi:bacillithiol biosynthesis cysteine-adding enzyme BshC